MWYNKTNSTEWCTVYTVYMFNLKVVLCALCLMFTNFANVIGFNLKVFMIRVANNFQIIINIPTKLS